jgi:hypothetical protein
LAAAEKIPRFFNRVFELLLLRNARKRDKKNRAKQPREGGKKTEETKIVLFGMSPDGFL